MTRLFFFNHIDNICLEKEALLYMITQGKSDFHPEDSVKDRLVISSYWLLALGFMAWPE